MNFTDAVAAVVAETKRPDKVTTVRRELNAAITFYCLDNKFSRDLAERTLAIDAAEYTQSFPLSECVRFRSFKYIKRGGTASHLSVLGDNEMLKVCADTDKYYIAGDNVNVKLGTLAATLDLGWYQYPPVLTGATNLNDFWLLDVAPWMIINRALSHVFKVIGDEKSMQIHAAMAKDDYMAARKDLGISTQ